MPKKGKRQGRETEGWKQLLLAVGEGIGTALGLTMVLLLGCAAAVWMGWISQRIGERCCVLSCVLGTLVGGTVSVKGGRSWALPVGLATGLGQCFVLVLLGMLAYQNPPVSGEVPEILLSCLCGGGMAGILGRGRKGKRRR